MVRFKHSCMDFDLQNDCSKSNTSHLNHLTVPCPFPADAHNIPAAQKPHGFQLLHALRQLTGSDRKASNESTHTSFRDSFDGRDSATTSTQPGTAHLLRSVLGCCPPYGVNAENGARSTMEDAHHTHPELCVVSLSDRCNAQLHDAIVHHGSHPHPPTSMQPSHSGLSAANSMQSLHFFGLYDGHAGNKASHQCARRLHYHLCRALVDSCTASGPCILDDSDFASPSSEHTISSDSCGQGSPTCSELLHPSCSQVAFPEGSPMAEWLARHPHSHHHQQHHGSSISSIQPEPGTCMLEAALHRAFLSMDHELEQAGSPMALMGSTAAVALVGKTHIWVANAGGCQRMLTGQGRWIRKSPACCTVMSM